METNELKLFDSRKDGYRLVRFDTAVRNDYFAMEHQDMIDVVGTGKRPRVTGEDALDVLRIAETAIRQIQKRSSSPKQQEHLCS